MPLIADPDNVYLSYYVLFTAVIGFFGWWALNFRPQIIRENYMPAYQAQFTPLAARSLGAWFLLCAIVRYAAWHNWGEKGWYDACIWSLALPLWHYGLETVRFGSVTWAQIFMAAAIDGFGGIWMFRARRDVLGL